MFALLGEVQFEVIGSPESIISSRRYDYAVHRVIQDRPKLQWLAPDLEILRFELMLHRSLTDPAADLAVLLAAAEAHQALPLIFGSGEFRGNFVISELSTLSRQLSGNGAPIAIAVRIELMESPPDIGPSLAAIVDFLPLATSAASALSAGGLKSSGATALPGLSPLIAIAGPVGAFAASLRPDDVPSASIVRRPA